MSKLSKKFRQLKFVQSLMAFRKKIFSSFSKYPQYRDRVRYLKWLFKFMTYPRYRAVYKALVKKNFKEISLFRPECAFTEFDLSLVAKNPLTKETLFIQVITKQHFDKKEEITYKGVIDSFELKKKVYTKTREEMRKIDPSKLDHLIEVIEFDTQNQNFALFISKFVNFQSLDKFMRSKKLSLEEKNSLIKQIEFYETFFNKCEIFWLDATPHNVMIMNNSLDLVPVDFANFSVGDLQQKKDANRISAKKLVDYLNSGIYLM
jgi:hypothetical protein